MCFFKNIIICIGIIICLLAIYYKPTYAVHQGFTTLSTIPKNIYTTWHTKELPPKMKECVERMKRANPEFVHHIYDEDECRQFIREQYDDKILDAFDSLVPLSYKSDLWRYCMLYKNGGIYIDIKFYPMNQFTFSQMIDREYFIKDLESSGDGVVNGFMICKPRNPKIGNCIDQIVENVKTNYYGDCPLHPTGPMLLKSQFTKDEMDNMEYELKINEHVYPEMFIVKNGHDINDAILATYPEYRTEQAAYGKLRHYSDIWHQRGIYTTR